MADLNMNEPLENKTSGDATQPVNIDDTQRIKVKAKKTRKARPVLIGILLLLLLGAAGAGLGYRQGIGDRLAKEKNQRLTEAATQFQYGIQQMTNNNYSLAKTHFDYVLQIYPDFPGLTEKYTEVMLKLAQSSVPTIQPLATPTLTNLNVEGLFNQATQEVQSMQWAAAMNTLEALRNEDTTYRTLDVDGLYFITLRHRAVEMIVNEGNLEEGLYLFTVVSRYAPLDHDAVNYANWARLYLTGASYWGVEWEQVVNYFSQLAAAFPYMHDGNGWTATDRLVKGSEFYGDQLAEAGDHCTAITHYQTALNYSQTEELQDKYNFSYQKCYPPTPVPQPTDIPEIETPEVEIPTEVPVEVTEEPTVAPDN